MIVKVYDEFHDLLSVLDCFTLSESHVVYPNLFAAASCSNAASSGC